MADQVGSLLLRYLGKRAREHRAEQRLDGELLACFVATSDEAAFAALLERHGPMVLRVCRRALHDPQAAEDAFQATFLVLARRAGAIGKRDLLAGWLHGVATRVAAKARVETARRARRESQVPVRTGTDPLEEITAREMIVVLDEELERLPPRFRVPLLLCYLEGHSREQVAARLGWSVRTLARRLERGRQLLRARLEGRGLALPGTLLLAALSPEKASAVPTSLATTTRKAAVLHASGRASGLASTKALALAEGVMPGLALVNVKTVLAVAAVLILVGAGAGGLSQRFRDVDPSAPPSSGPSAAPQTSALPSARTDSHGDPLPEGARARLGTTRLRHQHTIRAVTFSRDGSVLASAGWDGAVCAWDAARGRLLRRFAMPGGSSVAISPDGKLIAGGGMGQSLCLWELASGKELLRAANLENTVLTICFSADGKTLAAASGAILRLWDVPMRKEVLRITGPGGAVRSMAFSPDGKSLAAACEDHTARLWDAVTGKELRRFEGHGDALSSLAISSDGRTLATGAGDKDRTVRLWDLATGKELRRLPGPPGWVRPVAFSPDGRTLACGGQDRSIRFYEVASGKQVRQCRLPAEENTWIMSIAFSPDGKRLASAGTEKAIRLWDVSSGKELPFEGHQHEITHVALTPDGKTAVTAGQDGWIYLWDRTTGRIARRWNQAAPVAGLALSTDGKRLAVTEDRVVRLWDLEQQKEVQVFRGHQGSVDSVALSPDGGGLASAGWKDHTVRIWDVPSGKERVKVSLPSPQGANYGDCPLAFTPDGKGLVSGSADRTNPVFYLWDARTGKEVRRMEQQVSRLALSCDGRTLATAAGDRAVRLWDLGTGKEIRLLNGTAEVLAFSPDGRMLAGGDLSGVIRIWETASGQERCHFEGHRSGSDGQGSFGRGVAALAFSSDGKVLLSGGGDTTALLWDLIRPGARQRPLDTLWADLASADAAVAYESLCSLAAARGEAVSFLNRRLSPVRPADVRDLGRLIRDLDSDVFEERQKAMQRLESLGEVALPALRRVLTEGASEEARQRATRLIRKLAGPTPPREDLQGLRAIEALERIGTSEARALLQALAGGMPEARLTREAKASLQRLGKSTDSP